MKKVSFDFDDTLSTIEIQTLAKILVMQEYDVWIVTSRCSNLYAKNHHWNDDLEMVADCVGIPTENIVYCNLKPKYKYFQETEGFILHVDDDHDEILGINQHTDVQGVYYVPTIDRRSIKRIKEILCI